MVEAASLLNQLKTVKERLVKAKERQDKVMISFWKREKERVNKKINKLIGR